MPTTNQELLKMREELSHANSEINQLKEANHKLVEICAKSHKDLATYAAATIALFKLLGIKTIEELNIELPKNDLIMEMIPKLAELAKKDRSTTRPLAKRQKLGLEDI